jgi:hypothetical protein
MAMDTTLQKASLKEKNSKSYGFEECKKLLFEEHRRVNRWTSTLCVEIFCQIANKAEIDGSFYLGIEIIFGDQVFQRNFRE